MKQPESTAMKIHFFYITMILSLIILVLATKNWTNLKGFPEYLSVAAGITSLVLAILAIIYSFFSTGVMNQFLGSIQGSTSTMNGVAVEMRDALIKGQDIQARADQRTTELHSLAESLTISLASLGESTNNISGKVDSIPIQLSEMQDMLISSIPTNQAETAPDNSNSLWTNEHVAKVLKRASPYGIAVLKGISLAKENNMYLNLEKFKPPILSSYGYGYLTALQTTGFIKLESADEKNRKQAIRLLSGPNDIQELIDKEWDLRKLNPKHSKNLSNIEKIINVALHNGAPQVSDDDA